LDSLGYEFEGLFRHPARRQDLGLPPVQEPYERRV
jgi:hypothetical protein